MDTITKQILDLKKEADKLCSRKSELQEERTRKEKKLQEMESKLKSKDEQVRDSSENLQLFANLS